VPCDHQRPIAVNFPSGAVFDGSLGGIGARPEFSVKLCCFNLVSSAESNAARGGGAACVHKDRQQELKGQSLQVTLDSLE
jgi:hypothetical protein